MTEEISELTEDYLRKIDGVMGKILVYEHVLQTTKELREAHEAYAWYRGSLEMLTQLMLASARFDVWHIDQEIERASQTYEENCFYGLKEARKQLFEAFAGNSVTISRK